jgi:hypothetical protein
MTTFSHSGTTGDTFCSLVISKILGSGEFYLKLNNLEHVINTKLGWSNKGNRHEGIDSKHNERFEYVVVDDYFPKCIYENLEKWNHMIIPDAVFHVENLYREQEQY